MSNRVTIPWRDNYLVNDQWQVKAIERTITRTNRFWKEEQRTLPEKILKYDIKQNYNRSHKLSRVKLYRDNIYWKKEKKTFYVARLVYCVFNNLSYEDSKNVHYKNWNTLDCRLDNLYLSWEKFYITMEELYKKLNKNYEEERKEIASFVRDRDSIIRHYLDNNKDERPNLKLEDLTDDELIDRINEIECNDYYDSSIFDAGYLAWIEHVLRLIQSLRK